MRFFESPECRCSKRIGSVLWGLIKWRKYHAFRILRVYPWAFGKWELDWECEACGARGHLFGLTDTDLIQQGVPINELHKNRWWEPKNGEPQ